MKACPFAAKTSWRQQVIFFFRFAEETFETPRADHFSSNFGLFAANHDKFFAFHLPQKRVFTTSNFSFFFGKVQKSGSFFEPGPF